MGYFDKPEEGFDYLPWTDSETVFVELESRDIKRDEQGVRFNNALRRSSYFNVPKGFFILFSNLASAIWAKEKASPKVMGLDLHQFPLLLQFKSGYIKRYHAIRYPYAQALLHSRIPNDWYRGMDLVRGSVEGTNVNLKQKKKEMYLLAVGYFRSRHYTESEKFVSMCLEINPNCRKSLFLKEVIAYCYKQGKKSSISIDPPITSVELVAGILEANPRSSHPTWGIEKVPDSAHPITPKKYCQDPSEKTLPPLQAEGKKSSISVDPPITPVELVTGILEANPRSSHPTWDIEEQKDAIRNLYSWVLIHSRKPDDMYRGVNMLKGSVEGTNVNLKQKKKEMYLLAVGYFRSRHYTESEKFVSMCLEVSINPLIIFTFKIPRSGNLSPLLNMGQVR
uniref:Mitochondrial fission 1 protein A n=1 Tax=Tanacetum cinerariifolium TaxID=118510 RepID=A0A6L2JLQ3_TANCI|nr:mitochondrial fission 1 protein A [Tanacetum cinerariifolium]